MRVKMQRGAFLLVLSLMLLASFAGRTWSAQLQSGAVYLQFTYNPINSGVQDTITTVPTPTSDGANIIINGLTVASSATGDATYTICVNGLVNCYPPGVYSVIGCDLTSNQCTNTFLTINSQQLLSGVSLYIQYSQATSGTGDSISATSQPNVQDSTYITINGQKVASNPSGPATFTCGTSSPCSAPGSYTVVGCDLTNGVCSTPQTLTVVPAGNNLIACIITGTTTTFDSCISYALPIAMIGILLSLALIAICYMLDTVVRIQSLKRWYINELKETAKSIMIIALIFASLVILSGIAATLAGATPATGSGIIQTNLGQNLYGAASKYLQNEVLLATQAFYFSAGAALGVNFIQSVVLSTWIPVPILPIPGLLFAALQDGSKENIFQSSIIDTTGAGKNLSFLRDSLTFVIVPVLLVMQAQAVLLQSIIMIGLLVFLPIGIILRALPFLRGIGGTLIAIAIGLSLIYPTTLVAFNQPVTSFVVNNSGISIPTTCSFNFNNAILNALADGVLCNFFYAGGLYEAGAYAGLTSITSIYPLFNGVMYQILPLIIQFILLVLDIVIVVTLTNQLAKILGGSLRLQLGQFKLA